MCILGQIADQNYNLPNTNMTTLYWQVFKNLEREFQELADTIYINDAQHGKRFTDGLNGLLFNAVLNKQQY